MELSNLRTMKFGEDYHECEKHGVMLMKFSEMQNGTRVYECPHCLQEREEKEQAERNKVDRNSYIEMCKKCNIEKEFWDKQFSDYEAKTESQRQALSDCRLIAEGKSQRSVLLLGSNGLGKTMLGSLAVRERGGRIYSMYEIATRIKQSYSMRAEETELQIVNELARTPVLVIDEVGRSYGSRAEQNWLSYVIDKRHSRGLPLIIASNLHRMKNCRKGGCEDCIETYLGKDACSRLAQDADIVELEGEDWRRAHRKLAERL